MRYVALLRGINVGGKSLIRMAALRECVEGLGLDDVTTYIASGNVLFRSRERDPARLDTLLEQAIERHFALPVRVVVRSAREITRIAAGIPEAWIGVPELRVTVGFVLRDAGARSIA